MYSVQGSPHQDHITILVSATGTRMTKVIGPGGVQVAAPGRGTEFFVDERPLYGLADLYAALMEIASHSDRAIIRDRLKPGLLASTSHRRNRLTFDQVPHHWCMVDCDGIEALPGASPTDPYTVDWLVRNHLPPEFANARYIIQFSSSAGTAAAGRKIKVHLWFWLATPARSDALLGWAESCAVDPSVYRPVQIHFTADPIFQGCADPLPGPRVLFVQKAQEAVALTLPDASRSRFRQAIATPTAAVVGECGTLTEGREAWLLEWNLARVRETLAAGLPLDADRMAVVASAAFYAACSNADGTWPPERIAEKVSSTVRRAERGEIPGLPRVCLSPHWKLFPEPIGDIRAALARHVAEFFAGAGHG